MASDVECSQAEPVDNSNQQIYGQTKRALEFSSENHKVELANLPRSYSFHLVKSLVEKTYKVHPKKIRTGRGVAFLSFLSDSERDDAIAKLNDQPFKGRSLVAKIAAPREDALAKRARIDQPEDHQEDALPITDDEINSRICHYWGKDYEEQIKLKDQAMRSVLKFAPKIMAMSSKLEQEDPKLYEWCKSRKSIACQFDGVISSPQLEGYRNKCEFNVSKDGVVGFKMGRYRDGSDRVARPPNNCPVMTQDMFSIVDLLADHTANPSTKLRGYDPVTHEGNVRQLTIRRNERNEHMLIVDLQPHELGENELEDEIKLLVEALKSSNVSIVSIYVNISTKEHFMEADKTMRLVHGQAYLHECLTVTPECPLKFRIGPNSFFQVNTKVTELLYNSIIELANLKPNSFVLDVGSGVGTISLSLAKRVSWVAGIESVAAAVEDAKINASENNIDNVLFFANRAEVVLNEVIVILKQKLDEISQGGDIVAIVDPPRTGFASSFVKSIRASAINKIVYVACDPQANQNLTALCRPRSKAYQGQPFVPIRAKAFDMFPHTKFCELVVVYERLGLTV